MARSKSPARKSGQADKAVITEVFNNIDTDGNGTINLAEFKAALVSSCRLNDASGNKINPSAEDLLAAFRVADVDESGEIDFDEFCNAVKGGLSVGDVAWEQLSVGILGTLQLEKDAFFDAIDSVCDAHHENGYIRAFDSMDHGKLRAATGSLAHVSYFAFYLLLPLFDATFCWLVWKIPEWTTKHFNIQDIMDLARCYGLMGWQETRAQLFDSNNPLWPGALASVVALYVVSYILAKLYTRGQTPASFVVGLTYIKRNPAEVEVEEHAVKYPQSGEAQEWFRMFLLTSIVPVTCGGYMMNIYSRVGGFAASNVPTTEWCGMAGLLRLLALFFDPNLKMIAKKMFDGYSLLDLISGISLLNVYGHKQGFTFMGGVCKSQLVYTKSMSSTAKSNAKKRGTSVVASVFLFALVFALFTGEGYMAGRSLRLETEANAPDPHAVARKHAQQLCLESIGSKSEWRRWSLNNHPDKVKHMPGQAEEFQTLSDSYTIVTDFMKTDDYNERYPDSKKDWSSSLCIH
jgi:Ca2+-binding EF-hand superfamily protein